jgi:hypothetical protein
MEQVTELEQIAHLLGLKVSDLGGGRRTGLHRSGMTSARGTGYIGKAIDAMRQAIAAADGDEKAFADSLRDVRTAIERVLSHNDSDWPDTVVMTRETGGHGMLRIPVRR